MGGNELHGRLQATVEMARIGGTLAMQYFRKAGLAVREKTPGDPLTAADLAVSKRLAQEIGLRFPGEALLDEEGDGPSGDSGGTIWIIDPIDGTANFARGIARFAVSVACCMQGRPVCGAVYNPATEEMFHAGLGHGAWLGGQRLVMPSSRRAMVELGHAPGRGDAAFAALSGRCMEAGLDLRNGGSAALGLAEVAAGRLDGYAEASVFAWDVAAGLLLVTEAGGCDNGFFPRENISRAGCVVAASDWLYPVLSGLMDRKDAE